MVRIAWDLESLLEVEGSANQSKNPIEYQSSEFEDLSPLKISEYAFDKMIHVARDAFKVKQHSVESYWLLIGDEYVSDILIPEQYVSYASVSVPTESILKISEIIRKDHYKILGWGHSHADFSVFFSGTDRSNQKTIFHGTSNYIKTSKGEIIKYSYGSTFNVHSDTYAVLTYQKENEDIISIEIPIVIIETDKIFDASKENIDLRTLIRN